MTDYGKCEPMTTTHQPECRSNFIFGNERPICTNCSHGHYLDLNSEERQCKKCEEYGRNCSDCYIETIDNQTYCSHQMHCLKCVDGFVPFFETIDSKKIWTGCVIPNSVPGSEIDNDGDNKCKADTPIMIWEIE